MTKQEFVIKLRKKLSGLPRQEIDERINFYVEMIDDRIEEGLTEEQAVADIGTVGEIATQIISDIPLGKIAKERIKPQRQLEAWEIVLLVLGAPIWFSIVVALVSVVFSLYMVLWSVIISFWAVLVSVAVCSPALVIAAIVEAIGGNGWNAVLLVGVSIVCAGCAILFYLGCKYATKGAIWLSKQIVVGIKKCFVKKETAQ